jgi:hypothetical protein
MENGAVMPAMSRMAGRSIPGKLNILLTVAEILILATT